MKMKPFPILLRLIPLIIVVVALSNESTSGLHRAKAVDDYRVHLPVVARSCERQLPAQFSSDEGKETLMMEAINAQRLAHGLPAVQKHESLVQIARFHSHDMAINNFTGHDGSAGDFVYTRYQWLCEDWTWWGEIVGWGYTGDINRMVSWWMNSPGHRALILNEDFDYAGIGYSALPGSDWGHYWTVNFGRLYYSQLKLPEY